MTTIYVNEKKVDKKDLEKIEIKNENVKRILSGRLGAKSWKTRNFCL